MEQLWNNGLVPCIITLGIVPIVLRYNPVLGMTLPVIPVPESLKFFVRLSNDGEKIFEAHYMRGVSM